MQSDTVSRLQNMSSIVKTPSPLGGVQQQQQQEQPKASNNNNNSGQLDNIFNSVKRQVKTKINYSVNAYLYLFCVLD